MKKKKEIHQPEEERLDKKEFQMMTFAEADNTV